MTAQKVPELVAQLRRHSLALDAVQAASASVGGDAELVVFVYERAVVVEAVEQSIPRSRPLTSAERLLRDGASEAITESSSAVVLRGPDGVPAGALTVNVAVDDIHLGALHGVSRMISQQITALPSPRAGGVDGADSTVGGFDAAQFVSTAIVQDLADAVIAVDSIGVVRVINTAARQLFGIDPAMPVPSITLADVVLLDDAGGSLPMSEHPLASGHHAGFQRARHCVQGPLGLRHVTTVVRPMFFGESETGVVLTLRDDTEARAADAELEARALRDQLTGLANRRCLDELLLEIAGSDGAVSLAALFIDLDGFKVVNDVHGHRMGDRLLQKAASRLKAQLGSGDHLARHGGDEFVVLIPGVANTEVAVAIAENLRSVLGQPFEIDGTRCYLTASVGVTVELLPGIDSDSLLQRADIALDVAKQAGGNRVSLFNEEVAAAVEVAQSHRELIREVLQDGTLVMQFQPIVDSYTGRLLGVEALARCRHDDGSFFAPGRFLDSLGGTSLMVDLDKRAFDLSCQAAKRLAGVRPTRPISVACNFSGATLMQGDLVAMVMNMVNTHGVDPSQICIEVTESTAFDVGDLSINALNELKSAGFRVALDDFGTGYSSLSHLRDLPLSLVKVDRSFISKLIAGSPELAIARAIVRLADDLGLDTVAEGVETAEQLAAARAVGFRSIQGWYYSPAVDLDQILEMLDESVRFSA